MIVEFNTSPSVFGINYFLYSFGIFINKRQPHVISSSVHVFQGTGDPSHAKQQEERMQQMEEAKHTILAQALSQDARARRNNIKLINNLIYLMIMSYS